MANYKEQIRKLWKAYRKEVSAEPADLKDVAAWAIGKGLWKPRPIDLSASLAKDLADALRDEKRTDKAGREYRANLSVRTKSKGGLPLFKWGDIDDAPRSFVEKNIQQERRSISSDCYALSMKVEHYNDAHPTEEPIQIILNFEEDVEELKIARGLGGDEEDAA